MIEMRIKDVVGIVFAVCSLMLPAFADVPFTYSTNGNSIVVTGYTGTDPNVIIPDTINGLPVTDIGMSAFLYQINITNVVIPNGVLNIDQTAFDSCYSLASVAIPNGVTNIGAAAFQSTSLVNIAIPSSVTTLGISPFLNCPDLEAITVDPGNPSFSSVSGILFNKSQTVILQCTPANPATNYVIPSTVNAVWHDAFSSCTRLTDVFVPGAVTNIGDRAFKSCLALTNVTIGATVRIIGEDAFNNCIALSSVTVPDSVRNIGDGAFYHCVSLTNAIIGSGATNLGRVNTDGYGTFATCSNLTAIYFRSNAPIANAFVFLRATNITVYYLPGTTGWASTFGGQPTTLWLPLMQARTIGSDPGTNGFDFNICWADGQKIVIEACSNLNNPAWYPMRTDTVSSGVVHFNDPGSPSVPSRFYRVHAP
jgi:hypothetical protein